MDKTAAELGYMQLCATLGREPTPFQAFQAGVNYGQRLHETAMVQSFLEGASTLSMSQQPPPRLREAQELPPRVDNHVIVAIRRQRDATMSMARHHYHNHQFHMMFKMIKRARQLNKDVIFFQKHGNIAVCNNVGVNANG